MSPWGNSAFERLFYGVGEGKAAPSAGEGDASVSQGPSSSWSVASSCGSATAMEIWWLPLWSKSQSFPPAVVRKKR